MGLDREIEAQHLEQANTHIIEAERRIAKQVVILERLREAGHDVEEAEKMVVTFEAALMTLRDHRELIEDAIRRSDAGLI